MRILCRIAIVWVLVLSWPLSAEAKEVALKGSGKSPSGVGRVHLGKYDRHDPYIMGPQEVAITNIGGITLQFSIHYRLAMTDPWHVETLDPMDDGAYRYADSIRVDANDGTGRYVLYSLESQKRYVLDWDDHEKLWDVFVRQAAGEE
jgi:hypothetical protein